MWATYIYFLPVPVYRYKMLLYHSVAFALKYYDDIVLNVGDI